MIEVERLTKHYQVAKREPGLKAALRALFHRQHETVRAVNEISLSIKAGERVGFLGPNGAGKTTTLKMLSGLLHPTGGKARVLGFDPSRRAPEFLRQITLVMGQKQQLIWDLPPGETFEMNRAVYGVPRGEYEATRKELFELLQLDEIARKPTRQLSLGERMRCELVAALLHRPQVLFLDEPTIGLDVSMQLTVREFIRTYNERTGATVILTSHYMGDVSALCPRVIVIDGGQLRYDGDLPALVKTVRPGKRLTARLTAPLSPGELDRFGTPSLSPEEVTLDVPAEAVKDAAAHLLSLPQVSDLSIEDPPIEEAMRALFQAKPAQAEPSP
jgi:ABC-2 type transport system ATP-binding protein